MLAVKPTVAEGEEVFGVAHIFATFNDTFVVFSFISLCSFQHVTDLSGKETYARVTGGMMVKADHDESSPYAAMLAAQEVAKRCHVFFIAFSLFTFVFCHSFFLFKNLIFFFSSSVSLLSILSSVLLVVKVLRLLALVLNLLSELSLELA